MSFRFGFGFQIISQYINILRTFWRAFKKNVVSLGQNSLIMTKDINRLKVVLAEKKRTNKWLAEQLGKDQATVSKWCTNTIQPNLETMVRIAQVLKVEMNDLVRVEQQ